MIALLGRFPPGQCFSNLWPGAGNLRDGTIGCVSGAEAMLFGKREQSCWGLLMWFLAGLVMVAKARVGLPKATRHVLLATGTSLDRTLPHPPTG